MDNVELQAACAALGYLDGEEYHKEPDCLETVKDLIRFLRRDNDSCNTRRELGDAEIVSKDLIPILRQYPEDRILFDTVIRLLANLTQPARLCFQGHVPEDKTRRNYYLEIEGHLQSYKEAFADDALLGVFASKLGDLLKLDWEQRKEEDRLLIERILIIIRNILHVPPNIAKEMRTDDDASVHDQVLWALHVSGMEDLLIYIASSDSERQFAFHVLEIISLMFREQTAEQLATAGTGRAMSEKQRDERELSEMLQREKYQKKANAMKYSSRHSAFGGTFVVANMKSISDQNIIFHQPLEMANAIDLNLHKTNKKRPKNRLPVLDGDITRRSTLSIRLFLRDFCIQFLDNCYNSLMKAVKDLLARSKAQDSDETYYLWAMRFFMEFNRRVGFNISLVSETLSVNTFHYVQVNLQNYFDWVLTQHKEAVMWSRRMHLALKAYQELMSCINVMDQSPEAAIRNSAKVIKSNVFYTMEYREIFLLLLKHYDETKQSRSFLRDLVEATHLFMRMLEQYCKSHSHLVVQRPKKVRSKKQKKKKPKSAVSAELTEEQRAEIWDEISDGLSSLLQGECEVPSGAMPFDATSPIDIDQQRTDAVYRIQDHLHQKSHGEALALLRASREVWPGREEFGSDGLAPEEELMMLRQICLVALPADARSFQPEEMSEEEEGVDEIIEEEEEEPVHEIVEQEFSFVEFLNRFALPQVVRAYVLLLSEFHLNSSHTNHCAAKMLHRLAFGLELMPMIYQARLFRTFNRLLTDSVYRTAKQYEELRQFAKHVIRKFFETLKSNNKVVVELFFWKPKKEARQIAEGYTEITYSGKVKQTWTEDQDDELRMLFDQYRHLEKENIGEVDIVDYIMSRISDQTKSRRQVIRQLTYLGLISGAKELKRKGTVRKLGWTEEQEYELRRLFDECRNADDILGEISSKLSVPRSRPKLIEKILELGFVEDKKELRKKRRGKNKSDGTKRGHKSSECLVDSDDESDREGDVRTSDPESSDDDISRNDDDQDDTAPNRKPEPKKRAKGAIKTKARSEKPTRSSVPDKSKPRNFVMTLSKIPNLVARVKTNGLDGAVMWLKNSLARTAEDREEDNEYLAVPLVPIMEEHEDAMESSLFHELLKICGLYPPSSEQESYWRIDSTVSPTDLRRILAAFDAAPAVEFEVAPSGDSSHEHSDDDESLQNISSHRDSDNDDYRRPAPAEDDDNWILSKRSRQSALVALAKKRQEAAASDERQTRSEVQANKRSVEPNLSTPSAKSRLKRLVTSDDSESSEDDTRLVIDANDDECDDDNAGLPNRPTVVGSSAQRHDRNVAKKPRLLDSGSEHEDTILQGDEPATSRKTPMRRKRSDDEDASEDEMPAVRAAGLSRKRVAVESDSD